jgi:hypothetical protein
LGVFKLKFTTRGIIIGVMSVGLLTTGAIGVYKYNKEEQKKEIKAELKELNKERKKEQAVYDMYVAEYKYFEAKIDIGESSNSELEEVENKKVEQDYKIQKIYGKIVKLNNQLEK